MRLISVALAPSVMRSAKKYDTNLALYASHAITWPSLIGSSHMCAHASLYSHPHTNLHIIWGVWAIFAVRKVWRNGSTWAFSKSFLIPHRYSLMSRKWQHSLSRTHIALVHTYKYAQRKCVTYSSMYNWCKYVVVYISTYVHTVI